MAVSSLYIQCPMTKGRFSTLRKVSKRYGTRGNFGYMTIGQRVNWAVRQLGREQLGKGQLGSEEQFFKIMQLVL